MATPRKTMQGAPLGEKPSSSDNITLTKSELNELIANAVSAAVNAAARNTAASQPVSQARLDSNKRTRLESDFNYRLQANHRLGKEISEEETVLFSIPKIYEAYIGSIVASINGQTIKIPVDGVARRIPIRYVPIIQSYVENIDRKVATMNETANSKYGGIAELTGGAF